MTDKNFIRLLKTVRYTHEIQDYGNWISIIASDTEGLWLIDTHDAEPHSKGWWNTLRGVPLLDTHF